MFERLFLGHFTINTTFFPYEVLDFESMPLLMVGKHVIALNPNSPHGNAPKEVPNSKPSFVFLPYAQKCHFANQTHGTGSVGHC